ncbi:MAG: hypothetical protein GXO42_00105 [bacterium]|nr:hypothetical protein [bacterium]
MRGFLSLDFAISLVLLMTLAGFVAYQYSLHLRTARLLAAYINASSYQLVEHSVDFANSTSLAIAYTSYYDVPPMAVLRAWVSYCAHVKSNYTVICTQHGKCSVDNNPDDQLKPLLGNEGLCRHYYYNPKKKAYHIIRCHCSGGHHHHHRCRRRA